MNQYRIIDRLSSGSFGVVFKVVRLVDNRIFVLKRVPLAELDDQQKQTAIHEVDLMQQLHHPHIVLHREAFLFNRDDLCIVMDYYSGGDLSQVIRQAQEQLAELSSSDHVALEGDEHLGEAAVHRRQQHHGGPLTSRAIPGGVSTGAASESGRGGSMTASPPYLAESRVMLWFVEMALAIHYLHSHRIVHRDLKTQNVFLNAANGEVAVGDFGVAHIAESIAHAHAAAPSSTGTPLYMAPEVLQGGHGTFKSDVWSLGCILYEMLALRHPFASSDISGLIIRITKGEYAPLPLHYSKSVQKLVDRMLERDAKRRPLIDEILTMPIVKSYLHTYLSVRVPLEAHDSPSEVMLMRQLQALEVRAVGTECTEDVLTASPVEHALSAPALRSPTRAQDELMLSPTSKYDAIHRTHVREALVPPPQQQQVPSELGMLSAEAQTPTSGQSQQRRRAGQHQRTESNPLIHRDAVGDIPQQTKRSTSHEAPSNARRAQASMLPPFSVESSSSPGSNVDDMRGKTVSEIEQEVLRYRKLVQRESFALQQHHHLQQQQQHSSSGPTTVSSHFQPTVMPAADPNGTRGRRARGLVLSSEYATPSTVVASTAAADPHSFTESATGKLQQHHHCSPTPATGTGAIPEEAVPLSRRGTSTSQFYRALDRVGQAPSAPLKQNELMKMQRRKMLHAQCVDALGEKGFHQVYHYYNAVVAHQRDPEVVRNIIPERALWHVLPLVEEVLQIDRDVMKM